MLAGVGGLIFYTVLLGFVVGEQVVPWAGWPWLAVAMFGAFVVGLVRRRRAVAAYLFAIVVTKAMLLLSLLFIDNGYFVRELGIVAEGGVRANYYTLLACATLHVAASTFAGLERLPRSARVAPFPLEVVVVRAVVLALAFGASASLIATGLRSGFPLLQGVDRFAFAGGQGWLFTVLVAFKPILAAAMGFVRFRLPGGRAGRRAIDAAAVLLTVTVALFGDKFLSLIVLVGYYLLPGVAGGAWRGRVAWTRAAAVAGLLAVAVSGLTVFVYSDYGRLDAGRTGERLFGRFTGQGQLWYAAMREAPAVFGGDGAQAARLAAVMRDPAPDRRAFDARVGIFYMVARFAPDPIRRSVFASEGRVQFTGASEAYAALVFGQATMWGFALLTGVLFGALAAFMQRALVAGALPGFVGGAYLFMGAYTMANQAAPWVVFGPRALAYAAVVLGGDLLYRTVLARRPRRRT